ncbi:MAG: hypothetical protein P1P85_05475 [Patescibacteria group bacterium]|nr:hypothetical protein [Patescibacteria group bacterium]
MKIGTSDDLICEAFQYATDKAIKKAKRRAVDSCQYSEKQRVERNDKEALAEAIRRF